MHQNCLLRDVAIIIDSLHCQDLGTKTFKCFHFPKLLTLFTGIWMMADEQFYYTCFLYVVIAFIKAFTLLIMKQKTRVGIKTGLFFFIFNTETITCQWCPVFFKNCIPLQFFKWKWLSFSKTSNSSHSQEGPVYYTSKCSKTK